MIRLVRINENYDPLNEKTAEEIIPTQSPAKIASSIIKVVSKFFDEQTKRKLLGVNLKDQSLAIPESKNILVKAFMGAVGDKPAVTYYVSFRISFKDKDDGNIIDDYTIAKSAELKVLEGEEFSERDTVAAIKDVLAKAKKKLLSKQFTDNYELID